MTGRTLANRYKIIGHIGDGGMARVWRAQDLNTGKTVAVKVLRDEYREDETFVRRFEREALAASRMTHPNIVNLLDVGLEEDGTRYLVIEYVSGKTLRQFLNESGALRPDIAAQIIIRVLAAVQHAHQNGVIHRDIKPQNILIDKEGTVKVLDFGIARIANAQTMGQDTETIMGSVHYFSPEQAKGAAVDEKSDIYSVGIMFYEMLTGTVPFTGDTPVAIAMKHIQEAPVPPTEVKSDIPPAMDFVIMNALEKRPRNRYASASDMLQDVRLALEHPDTLLAAREEARRREAQARAAQKRKRGVERRVLWMRRLLVGIFTLMLLGVMALAGYVITEQVLKSRGNTVEVPSVIGMNKIEAVNLLTDLGLSPNIVHKTYTYVTEDIVADQSIVPGTFVEKGTEITITACLSQFDMRVPKIVGMMVTNAYSLLDGLGLVVEVTEVVSTAAQGTVVAQTPDEGYINKGSTISLLISRGSTVMPRLLGKTYEDILDDISAFGLRLHEVSEKAVDDPSQVGKVVMQSPEFYTEIAPGSEVDIWLGVASSDLKKAIITLDLTTLSSGLTAGDAVNIIIDGDSNNDSLQISFAYEAGETSISFTVYSSTARRTNYTVYVNKEIREVGSLVFEP